MIEMKQFKDLADNLMGEIKVTDDLKNRTITRFKKIKVCGKHRCSFNINGKSGKGIFWRFNKYLVPAVCFVLILGIVHFSGILQLLNFQNGLKSDEIIKGLTLSRSEKIYNSQELNIDLEQSDELINDEQGDKGNNADNETVLSSQDAVCGANGAGNNEIVGEDSDSSDSLDRNRSAGSDDTLSPADDCSNRDRVIDSENDDQKFGMACTKYYDEFVTNQVLSSYEEAQSIFTGEFLKPGYLPGGFRLDEIKAFGSDNNTANIVCISYISDKGVFRIIEKHPAENSIDAEKLKQGKPVFIINEEGYINVKEINNTVYTELYWSKNNTLYIIEGYIDETTAINAAEGMK